MQETIILLSPFIYYGVVGIIFVLLLFWAISLIKSFVENNKTTENPETFSKNVLIGITKLFIIFGFFSAFTIVGWSVKQRLLADMSSSYENKSQRKQISETKKYKERTDEERRKNKEKLKKTRDDKPHEDVLSEFDKIMQTENKKIKERNNLE